MTTDPTIETGAAKPRRGRLTWVFIALTAVVLAVVGGWTALWFSFARDIERLAGQWIEARRAEGYFVVLGEPRIGGFPFRFTTRFELPVLATTGPSTLSWFADWVEASAPVWAPQRISLSVARNTFTYSSRGNSRDIELTSDGAHFDVLTNGTGRPETALVALSRPRLHLTILGRPIEAGELELAFTWPQLLPGDEFPRAALSLAASDITSTLPAFTQLGRSVRRLRGNAILRGTWQDGPWALALAAWRDAGGTLDLQGFRLEWDGLAIDGDATWALDREMRPIGAGSFAILGLSSLIDALQRLGVLNARAAAGAKLAFSLLPSEGGKTAVAVSAQDGRLFIGPLPVARLAPVDTLSLDRALRPD